MDTPPCFKLSIDINFKKFVVTVILLATILGTPFIINYAKNKEESSLSHVLGEFTASEEVEDRFIITLPLINIDLDLTIIKQNSQVVVYIGFGLVAVALIVGVVLIKRLLKNEPSCAFSQEK